MTDSNELVLTEHIPQYYISKLLKMNSNEITDLLKKVRFYNHGDNLFGKTEKKIAYLRKLKHENAEIYVDLVWTIRESLNTEYQREVKSLPLPPHYECLKAACKFLGLDYEIDLKRRAFYIWTKGRENACLMFKNYKTPFNSQTAAEISSDKDLTYSLLHEFICMPRSIPFLDFNVQEQYRPYLTANSVAEIMESVEKWFSYPVIVKKNFGSQGKGVFLCNNRSETTEAVSRIFDKTYPEYDYLLLVQRKIDILKEYRVVIFQGKVILCYLKDTSEGLLSDNISPLHWEGSKTIVQTDVDLLNKMQNFVSPIFERIDLQFSGLDVVEDTLGKLFLIELNASPGFNYFLADNPAYMLVNMYTKMLQSQM
jgi:hypothetical protein